MSLDQSKAVLERLHSGIGCLALHTNFPRIITCLQLLQVVSSLGYFFHSYTSDKFPEIPVPVKL